MNRQSTSQRRFGSAFRRFHREERGQGMVEFALVASLVFIPLVFGIIEFGRVVWSKNMVTAAAREGVRFAIVHGSESGAQADSAAVADYVKGRTQLSPIVVRPAWTGFEHGDTVTVSVQYTYTPLMRVPGLPASKTVVGVSKQVVAY